MAFVMRKLDVAPQLLGDKLRALRRGKAITLDLIEKKTHIQRRYLEALERGRYDLLPEPLYTRNFIRSYARALGADEQYFIELYEDEVGVCDLVKPLQTPRQRVRAKLLFVWNRAIPMAMVSLVILGVCSYIGYQIVRLTAPPDIIVFSPVDQSISSSPILLVEGLGEKETTILINHEEVVVNDDQTFSTEIHLDRGINTITIEASRRYSRKVEIERTVLFNPDTVSLDL